MSEPRSLSTERVASGLGARALELRQAFDRSFAEAPADTSLERIDLVALSAGSDPYAIRLADVAGLFKDKKIQRLPTTTSDLVGLAGFRGAVVPVFDLALMLGYPRAAATRWLVLLREMTASGVGAALHEDGRARAPLRGGAIALAVEAFESHLRVKGAAVTTSRAAARAHVCGVVREGDRSYALLDVASIGRAIAAHVEPTSARGGP